MDKDSLKQVWETAGEKEERQDNGGCRSCPVNHEVWEGFLRTIIVITTQQQFISLFRGNFPNKNRTGSKNNIIIIIKKKTKTIY